MSFVFKILQVADIDDILEYENKKLEESIPDEMARTLSSWNARWRKEALEHYIPMGWSFVARDELHKIIGYFIAQPFLFFDGQTQTLWVEYLQHSSIQVRDQLCDIAFKLAREKHLQKVLFPNMAGVQNSVNSMKAESWSPNAFEVKTTKASV